MFSVGFICFCGKTWVSLIFVLFFSPILNRPKKIECFKTNSFKDYCYGSWLWTGLATHTRTMPRRLSRPRARAHFCFDFIWFSVMSYLEIFCWVWLGLTGSNIVYLNISRFSRGLLEPQGVRTAINTALSRTLSVRETITSKTSSLSLCHNSAIEKLNFFVKFANFYLSRGMSSHRRQVLVIYRESLYR